MPPATIDAEILTTLLNAYMEVATGGLARLVPHARWILVALLTIELAVLGAWIGMGAVSNYAVALAEIGMKATFYVMLIQYWQWITRHLIRFFIALGLLGSGGVMSQADFSDPSKLAAFGIQAMVPVMNRLTAYTGWDVPFNLPDILFTGWAALWAIVAFAVYGIIVFLVQLLFYFMSTACVVLIPWGMIRQTSFLAEKAFAYMWAVAVMLLVLALISGTSLSVLRSGLIAPGPTPGFGQCFTFAMAGTAMVLLAIVAPLVALGLLHGTPNLTPQQVGSAARSIAHSVQRLAHTMQTVAPSPSAAAHGAGANTRRPVR